MFSLFVGFVLGALVVVFAEAYTLYFLFNRLSRRKTSLKDQDSQVARDLDSEQSLDFFYNKKGVIWILDSEKVSAQESTRKAAEQKNKKEIVEVFPIKKNAKIKDHSLILIDSDGSQATIELVGCVIVAVSASSLSSRKWAKRYPVKVEDKESAIYKGSNSVYLFFETSWEKESWCKALRLASCPGNKRIKWYAKLTEEFHQYLSSLNEEYPFFMKPAALFGESTERGNRIDGSSSKVRHFLKKLSKKASRGAADYKASQVSSLLRDDRKPGDKSRSYQDRILATSDRTVLSSTEEDSSNHSSNQGHMSNNIDADGDEKFGYDEGTLCWNLLLSRLFFDVKRSTELNSFIQARIQRTLSNMRIPSYVGGIMCAGVDIGNLPPYIHNMRVLAMDMKEVWSMEVDIEYSGGAMLYVETRLDVREPDFQKGIENSSREPSTAENVTSDLLEGFEHYGDQLKLSSKSAERTEKGDEGDKLDGMKNPKSTGWASTCVSRWKNIVNSLAEQVSQVPLSMAIKVVSLKGTIRLHIKPPPSDHIWFGFTSMPEIEWNLESAVGDHKITSSHIALLISNRFKAAIRETLVLPNCECVCIPWMLAEKDDWVPRQVAPFIWVHQEHGDLTGRSASNNQPGDVQTKASPMKDGRDQNINKGKDAMSPNRSPAEPVSLLASSSQSGSTTSLSDNQLLQSKAVEDLKEPLLLRDKSQESSLSSRAESPDHSGVIVTTEGQTTTYEDLKPKKTGRRARMIDLGKKMGEKFEEKRRHIEEKGRIIVEKMRGHEL